MKVLRMAFPVPYQGTRFTDFQKAAKSLNQTYLYFFTSFPLNFLTFP